MKEKMKKAFQSNSFKYGTFSIILSVIVIAMVVGVNLLMSMLPTAVTKMDISDNKLYSIGEKTEQLVSGVNEDITIYTVGKEENINRVFSQMLEKYMDLNSHISVKHVDPDFDPQFLAKYELTGDDLSGNMDVVVEGEKRFKFLTFYDIYDVDRNQYYYYMNHMLSSYDASFDGEGEITSAISYVTSDNIPKMYLLSGHKEGALDDKIKTLFEKNNIKLDDLNLVKTGAIPEDCDIIMIYLPQTDFSEDEVKLLESYIAYGGKCVVFNCANTLPDMKNYKEFLAYYGVAISERSFLFEGTANCVYPNRYWLYEPLESNEYTKDISGEYALAPLASAITQLDNKRNTLKITPILSTSSDSWLRTDLESKKMDEKIASDVDGPFDFAVSIVDSTNEGQGKLAIFACDNFLAISALNQYVTNYSNGEIILKVLSSMASLQSSVAIESKSLDIKLNTFTAQEFNVSLVILVIVIPVVIMIAGFVVWMTRRRR